MSDSVIEYGDDTMVIETDRFLTREQRAVMAEACEGGINGRKVVVLDGGMKVARNYSEQLDRIEAKLDELREWLADEGEQEDEGIGFTTMDGEVIRLSGDEVTL